MEARQSVNKPTNQLGYIIAYTTALCPTSCKMGIGATWITTSKKYTHRLWCKDFMLLDRLSLGNLDSQRFSQTSNPLAIVLMLCPVLSLMVSTAVTDRTALGTTTTPWFHPLCLTAFQCTCRHCAVGQIQQMNLPATSYFSCHR